MKITINTDLGSYRRDVETFEDVIDLMHNITKIWSQEDKNWRGA